MSQWLVRPAKCVKSQLVTVSLNVRQWIYRLIVSFSITDGFNRPIHGTRRHSADGLDDIDALGHASENRMAVIQVRCRSQCDEKLAAVGVRTGVGHGKNAFRVMAQAGVEFVFKAVAGATCSGALRAPALNDKSCNHPVKGKAVVEGTLPFRWVGVPLLN